LFSNVSDLKFVRLYARSVRMLSGMLSGMLGTSSKLIVGGRTFTVLLSCLSVVYDGERPEQKLHFSGRKARSVRSPDVLHDYK
jgi:hypothetical protein